MPDDDTIPRASRFDTLRRALRRELLPGRLARTPADRIGAARRIDGAPLPEPARDLVRRVVRRTKLWPRERAEVADELIAHFADGLADGATAENLITSFGDERRRDG
jgi:hypothetical protein